MEFHSRIGRWESLSSLWTTADKHQRFVLFILLHQGGVFKTLQHCRLSLNSSVRNVADFIAVECSPMLYKVLAVKLQDIMIVHKINKGVAAVASILEVDGKVKKVNNSRSMFVFSKLFKKHFLSVFVRNVSNHQRCSRIQAILYRL